MAIITENMNRIQETIYRPILEKSELGIRVRNRKDIHQQLQYDSCSYNYININNDDIYKIEYTRNIDSVISKYKSICYPIRNIGEKTIRNFRCVSLDIEDVDITFRSWVPKDIMAGETLGIVFVNIPIVDNSCKTLTAKFLFSNVLLENYILDIKLNLVTYEGFLLYCDKFDISQTNKKEKALLFEKQ